ncbi:Bax protein [Enhydrobacter aerosaccus]|uniref:Bax protein n=1 Tax=Enhydrobacter aerosaccus TaxID=225324 RepID=A0A1T4R469_9HYPH|nr:glucosaminidase domain-containing protein [Enhydrobacter aerosaccus]SKA10743.1 Bax protein [Enhydrobacter aerosaccus]
MQLSIRHYAFPAVWLAVFATGVSLRHPVPQADAMAALSARIGEPADPAQPPPFLSNSPFPTSLTFAAPVPSELDQMMQVTSRDFLGGHGRFAAPGNAVRRQVQLRAINPRTADELAGAFRDVSFTLTDIRQGEAVPPLKVQRVPDDLGSKDGTSRKVLFITALLPVILEINQRVLGERDQLLYLKGKLDSGAGITPVERVWLEQLADRYDTPADNLEELVRRVDIVPPSMAIAQAGVESGWGTSFAARTGNALFGQIQAVGQHAVSVSWKPGAGMPQPFANIGEAAEAYVLNLDSHPAYAAFRTERAAMRRRGEPLEGFRLIGQLARYSELGQSYVQFVRQVMRENDMGDFDKAKLSSF